MAKLLFASSKTRICSTKVVFSLTSRELLLFSMIQLKSISAELHWICSKAIDFLPTQKINTFFSDTIWEILPLDIMKAYIFGCKFISKYVHKIASISMSFLPLFKFYIMVESIMSSTDASMLNCRAIYTLVHQ